MADDARLPLSTSDEKALARLAAKYERLNVAGAYRSSYSGWVLGVTHQALMHREIIGCSSVRQVREAVEAIEGAYPSV